MNSADTSQPNSKPPTGTAPTNDTNNQKDVETPDVNTRPPPKFKLGDLVARHARPTQALRIWNEPRWTNYTGQREQWMYDYEYGLGGTSEGAALESELRLVPSDSYI